MQELRDLAATTLQGFIVDPPYLLSTERVQGVNLSIDRYWLRTYRSQYAWHTEGTPAGFSFRTRRMAVGKTLDFKWRPAGWNRHCATLGYPENAQPVVIDVLLRERPDAGFLAEAPVPISLIPSATRRASPVSRMAPRRSRLAMKWQ